MKVDFEPVGLRVTCEGGTSLLEAAQTAGVLLSAVCGGNGTCGRCVVNVLEGEVSALTVAERETLGGERGSSARLACQTKVLTDVLVHVPSDSLVGVQRIQTEGELPAIELNPAVRPVETHIDKPTISDLRSDATRLRDGLGYAGVPKSTDLHIDPSVLREMSDNLRSSNWEVCAFVREIRGSEAAPDLARSRIAGPPELIALRPLGASPLGLAVDIGTTKLAVYLMDLVKGETIASAGAMNPQIAYGEDVMARIGHAVRNPGGSNQLRLVVIEVLDKMARELCVQTERDFADIADAVFVCNTAMHHLFLGLPVGQLGSAPYVPVESAPLDMKAREVGLDLAPGAYIHVLPNVAGFVGADHVGMLVATGAAERKGVVLAIDVGTNTEISLHAHGRHLACSAASGPAFEGAHIRYGMRAAPGAIERVTLQGERVYVKTVGDEPSVGLCGSGVLDLVAQLVKSGVIGPRGALNAHPRVRHCDTGGKEFVVVRADENDGREITLSRSDVAEIQLAKAAIITGIRILLDKADVDEREIEEIVIAGAFGTYVDVQSCIDIGMFPAVGLHRFRQVGNGAGAGARMALLSVDQRRRAERIALNIEYVELAVEQKFKAEFTRSLRFGN
jgi:uncharacterized 2Fe-2S/4Fe-4S cluster protein (DUF4445 family)